MANKKASEKDIRRSTKQRIINKTLVSRMRTYIKNLHNMVVNKQIKEAEVYFSSVNSIIDKAVKVNLIKKNNRSRKISRIHQFLKKNGCFA